MMRRAGQLQAELADSKGPAARKRVELLRLRFEEGLPIREIAHQWDQEATKVHHEYAQARKEFEAALRQTVSSYLSGSRSKLEDECAMLLRILG